MTSDDFRAEMDARCDALKAYGNRLLAKRRADSLVADGMTKEEAEREAIRYINAIVAACGSVPIEPPL